MKYIFEYVEFFSATFDVWSRSNRSFFAVSVHYIDSISEAGNTKFFACESFEGNHTNDKIAEKLNQIFDRFGILEKVFFLTTDGAGEYVAAAKYYGDNYRSMQSPISDEDIEWLGQGRNTVNANANANANGRSLQSQSDIDSDSESETDDRDIKTFDAVSFFRI